jgi:hypothetical protein
VLAAPYGLGSEHGTVPRAVLRVLTVVTGSYRYGPRGPVQHGAGAHRLTGLHGYASRPGPPARVTDCVGHRATVRAADWLRTGRTPGPGRFPDYWTRVGSPGPTERASPGPPAWPPGPSPLGSPAPGGAGRGGALPRTRPRETGSAALGAAADLHADPHGDFAFPTGTRDMALDGNDPADAHGKSPSGLSGLAGFLRRRLPAADRQYITPGFDAENMSPLRVS